MLKYDKVMLFQTRHPPDFDIVKNIYLAKRQEHVTNLKYYCQHSITNATFNAT